MHAKIKQVDSHATLGSGIVVQVRVGHCGGACWEGGEWRGGALEMLGLGMNVDGGHYL